MTDIVRFEPWPDPEVEALGYHVRDPYVESCWTWILGPTSLLLLRAVATEFAVENGPFVVDLGEVAQRLGVGTGTGRHSVIRRTLGRLERYKFAVELPEGFAVRQHARPLPERLWKRAPASVRELDLAFAQRRHPSHRAA
ncbi:MAG TPA: hypothetical protein VFA94_01340 [Acidimicrobiales bacterium]|nr:hypothetical protein [Acidimicrobiales bacterium]